MVGQCTAVYILNFRFLDSFEIINFLFKIAGSLRLISNFFLNDQKLRVVKLVTARCICNVNFQ